MIYEILLEGKENAITAKDIAKLFGWKDTRDVSEQIERERREGKPIAASCGKNPGYYIATDRETMQRYCNSLLHRMGEIAATRQGCLKSMEGLPDSEGA